MIFSRALLYLKQLLFRRAHRDRAHRLLFAQMWKPKWGARDLISKQVGQDVEDQVWYQLSIPATMESMKHIYDLLVAQAIDDIHTRSPLS